MITARHMANANVRKLFILNVQFLRARAECTRHAQAARNLPDGLEQNEAWEQYAIAFTKKEMIHSRCQDLRLRIRRIHLLQSNEAPDWLIGLNAMGGV